MDHASDESDAEIIALSVDEPEAFGSIFDRHGATLLRYLTRRVGRPTAEGLLGDLFRIAFERRASFDPSRPLARPWLYGIAANLLLNHRRTEARRLNAMAKSEANRGIDTSQSRDESERLDARVLLPKLVGWIDALPDGEREALLLFAWEDLSYPDIAAALGIPIGTVRSRLHRARARLRELIEACGKQPDERLTSDVSEEPVGHRR
jgi:RNA polymerase sigma factor (sigma-70 family)